MARPIDMTNDDDVIRGALQFVADARLIDVASAVGGDLREAERFRATCEELADAYARENTDDR